MTRPHFCFRNNKSIGYVQEKDILGRPEFEAFFGSVTGGAVSLGKAEGVAEALKLIRKEHDYRAKAKGKR